jgi:LmbE family N-acetylglucosaminyl deacetylase
MPTVPWETITGNENLLILAARPGDESLIFGGLIARCCRRGRPPFVVVLTDGSAMPAGSNAMSPDQRAARHERETRAAARHLGLPANRLLMAGLLDGAEPREGPAFDALVDGIRLIMWARDCNVICASDQPDIHRIAAAVAASSGVGLLSRLTHAADTAWRLDIRPELPAKYAAISEHAAAAVPGGLDTAEYFIP